MICWLIPGHIFLRFRSKLLGLVRGFLDTNAFADSRAANKRIAYLNNEIDFFAVYCPSNNLLYGIPVSNHPSGGWLRLEPTKNKQTKLIRLASDYTWEKHLEELKGKYARQELNLRPFGSEPNTLSPELRARNEIIAQI